jgi:1,4-alpha-glucan branching enzyme
VLGATYVTAGVRIATARTEPLPALTNPAPIIAAARARKPTSSLTTARLEITPTASLHTIRVHAVNASSVEVMADFTDWQPIQLQLVRDGIWEIKQELTLGVHRLNVRVNGGEWFVPEGAREEQDEFGSVVGIIVVR